MEKINVAKLLKDCPKGMELDCTIFDNVVFDGFDFSLSNHPIIIRRLKTNVRNFVTKYGQFNGDEDGKCVIFPKGKTTWEGFVPPCKFKEGDIVVSELGDIHLLRTYNSSYCAYRIRWQTKLDPHITTDVNVIRFATEEEKEKLFKAIKDNRYKWNAEKKELEKLIEPKFKVGDKIVKRGSIANSWIVSSVCSEYYRLQLPKGSEDIGVMLISEQDDWELVIDKFDINTLKPFKSNVLVRGGDDLLWLPATFGFFNGEYFCVLGGNMYRQCIPFENNEHLLNTNSNCKEYYKTWK